jgi:hypothetical protein
VRNGLERPDRPFELSTIPRILDGHLERSFSSTERVRELRDRRTVDGASEDGILLSVVAIRGPVVDARGAQSFR